MARPLMGLISLVLLAAAIVLEFFIILSGSITSSPEDLVYFLQADTSGIPGAPNPARWTYWAVCGVDGKHNANCGAVVPALPFSPANRRNFGTDQGVPDAFLDTRKYFYLSRFAWVFFLLALLFSAFALFTGLLALCTRFGAYLSGLNVAIALFWQTLAAALMTAWTVEARDEWRKNGHDATLGKYGYGFTWATVALLFLAMITFCAAGGSRHKHRDTYVAESAPRRRFWQRRHRSVRKEYV